MNYQQKAIDSVRTKFKELQKESFDILQNLSVQTDKNLSDYYESKYTIYTDLVSLYDNLIEGGSFEND